MSIRLTGETGPLPSEGAAASTPNDDYSGSWSAWADSADKGIESVVKPVIDGVVKTYESGKEFTGKAWSKVDVAQAYADAASGAPLAVSMFSAGIVATKVVEKTGCPLQ